MTDVATLLGGDAARGNPDVVRGIAARMREVARDVDDVRRQVENPGLDGRWSGDASEAFRASLADVPGELRKVTSSYQGAASALDVYAGALRHVLDRSRAAAARIDSAEARQRAAAAARHAANRELGNAQRRHHMTHDPAVRGSTRAAVERAAASTARAHAHESAAAHEVAVARGEGSRLRGDLDHAVEECVRALDRAASERIRTDILARLGDLAADGFELAAGVVVNVVKGTWDEIAEGFKAALEYVKNPSFEALSKVFGGIGVILGLVGLVALVLAVAVPSLAALATVAVVAGILGLVFAVGKTIADVGWLTVEDGGDEAAQELVEDAIAVPLAALGAKGGIHGLYKARGAGSQTWVTRYIRWGPTGLKPSIGRVIVEDVTLRLVDEGYRAVLRRDRSGGDIAAPVFAPGGSVGRPPVPLASPLGTGWSVCPSTVVVHRAPLTAGAAR